MGSLFASVEQKIRGLKVGYVPDSVKIRYSQNDCYGANAAYSP